MSDTLTLRPQQSLLSIALGKLRRNKAAMASAIYLMLMAVACIVGPSLTGHDFATIYRSFVRVPPSLEAYPKLDALEQELVEALKRARVEHSNFKDAGSSVSFKLTSTQGVDPRVTRFIDRSDTFEGAAIVSTSQDQTTAEVTASVDRRRFLFGTDVSGRDMLTRTLKAGQTSLFVGLMSGLVAVGIGVAYGAASGFIGGRTDEIMMRVVDILYSLPFTFFVIMLVVFFGRHLSLMFIAIGAVMWLDMARIVRGQTLSLKRREFVLAAEALGVSPATILWRHIVPNMLGPIIIFVTLLVPQVIILESFLSYLGLGVQEPNSSWGVQISEGSRNMESAPWLLLFPAFFLTSTLFALNFLGDGLRDALDPKDN
jgi:oligopeptide transport system permease protein